LRKRPRCRESNWPYRGDVENRACKLPMNRPPGKWPAELDLEKLPARRRRGDRRNCLLSPSPTASRLKCSNPLASNHPSAPLDKHSRSRAATRNTAAGNIANRGVTISQQRSRRWTSFRDALAQSIQNPTSFQIKNTHRTSSRTVHPACLPECPGNGPGCYAGMLGHTDPLSRARAGIGSRLGKPKTTSCKPSGRPKRSTRRPDRWSGANESA